MKKTIAIVDDHSLFAQSLTALINSFEDYEVAFLAKNGKELITQLKARDVHPDIILLDVNMPVMNGVDAMQVLNKEFGAIKVMALSMNDEEDMIISMLRNGAKGYLLKDIHPDTLKIALDDILNKGFYYTEKVSSLLLGTLTEEDNKVKLKDREINFLKLVCSEKTYKEIASDMCLSPKTIDGYREVLFDKLQVRSRIGLVLYAIKNKIYEVE